MKNRRWFRLLVAVVAAGGLIGSGFAVQSHAAPSSAAGKIKIGVSVSLSGDFSGDGQAIKRGYQLWQQWVNGHGGLLGRKVTFDFVDDASSTTQVATNYQKLIQVDKVNLVFGPFSSLLTVPAATVANRYGYAFPEPAGGAPGVFALKLPNLAFVQPAPVVNNLVGFVHFVLSRGKNQRPKTAAYVAEQDPFSPPQVARAQSLLQHAGVKTVYRGSFPSESTDIQPLALRIAHSKAQVVVVGTTGLPDATGFIKTFIQQHYNPKAIIESSGPDQGAQFSGPVGLKNTEGVMVADGWWTGEKTFQNKWMVNQYLKRWGGNKGSISGDISEAFSVGQVVYQAAKQIHSINNHRLIQALHRYHFKSVQGPMKFNKLGEPQGVMFLMQWQHGQTVPVYPPRVAVHSPEYPKPHWH
ncbi:MAG: amino acid ABC transporter substrate-binding protein [Chloroflexota bacterium]